MKSTKKVIFAAAGLVFALGLFTQCKGKLPDTSSKIVTQPQPFDSSITALELSKKMGNGINLSNTLEAFGAEELGLGKDPKEYETFWGQPVTTPELMKLYKESGFDTIRIPVAWTNAMDWKNKNYVIGTDYIDRVEEVVNYALDAGLYVIFNDHWDGDWWGMFGSASEATRAEAWKMYEAMWTQLAVRFKNYSEKVIFEGGNEEIGNRLNDVFAVPDSGSLKGDEIYEVANKINQKFVDVVRKTGGNNSQRFLLIPGYNTDVGMTCDDRFVMPKDSAKDKLFVSVHYYTPWGYCGGSSVTHWGTVREVGEMNNNMEKLSRFVDAGYGVIIGEYGTGLRSDGTLKDGNMDWHENFLDNCDYYNYVPVMWDTGEWGMFDRKTGFKFQEMTDFYKSRSYEALLAYDEEEWREEAYNRTLDRYDDAPEMISDNELVGATDRSVAWIMYNSQDWSLTYSVGDIYDPDTRSEGLIPTDVEITGPGTYTVALDFTGTEAGFARSFAFSAIGISNGELLFPGYCIQIKEFKVNGENYRLPSKGYTSSDDGKCTRYNIYNEWVSEPPAEARSFDGSMDRKRPTIVQQDAAILQEMKTLEITFEYKLPE